MFNKLKKNAAKLADKAREGVNYIPDDLKNKIINTVSEKSERVLNRVKGGSSDDLTLDKEEVKDELNKYKKNASPDDIDKVNKKIGGMQKGDLKKIWDKVILLWEMTKDSSAQWESKAIAVGALIYTVSPIDAIPDMIPVLGLTDDAGVIIAAVSALGTSLAKYSSEKSNQDVTSPMLIKESSINDDLESMKVIVSTLARAAYADGELSKEEEAISFKIIECFIFSDNGILPKDKIDSSTFTKKELKKIISDTFENPISLNKIATYSIDKEQEEASYLYAYSVVAIDDDINKSEREFLEIFSELLELTSLDKNNIERNYKKDWLSIS